MFATLKCLSKKLTTFWHAKPHLTACGAATPKKNTDNLSEMHRTMPRSMSKSFMIACSVMAQAWTCASLFSPPW